MTRELTMTNRVPVFNKSFLIDVLNQDKDIVVEFFIDKVSSRSKNNDNLSI